MRHGAIFFGRQPGKKKKLSQPPPPQPKPIVVEAAKAEILTPEAIVIEPTPSPLVVEEPCPSGPETGYFLPLSFSPEEVCFLCERVQPFCIDVEGTLLCPICRAPELPKKKSKFVRKGALLQPAD
jgi:hypothetical protein